MTLPFEQSTEQSIQQSADQPTEQSPEQVAEKLQVAETQSTNSSAQEFSQYAQNQLPATDASVTCSEVTCPTATRSAFAPSTSAHSSFALPAFGRRETLLAALHCLQALHPGPCQIVETGTLRDDRAGAAQSDGWSTRAWGWYAARHQGRVWTVDVDAAALEICRRLTGTYAASITYVCRDSLAFLREWQRDVDGPIHFLYLDSLDYADRERSEAHHLEEARAALPHLHEVALVLLDDTCLAPRAQPKDRGEDDQESSPWEGQWESKWEGKGARAIPYLVEQGFAVVWEPYEHWSHGGQVLLVRGAPVELLQELLGTIEGTEAQWSDGEELDGEGIGGKWKGASAAPETSDPPSVRQSVRQSAQPSRQRHWQPRPLRDVPYQFAALATEPHLTAYLASVLRHCPPGARTLEVESGTGLGRERFAGLGAIWLSLREVQAEGCDDVPVLIEQARYANSVLGGAARFDVVDLFDLYRHYTQDKGDSGIGQSLLDPYAAPYHVIHHHNLLHQFALPWMRALLAQQMALAQWVIFSVPSVYYGEECPESPGGREQGIHEDTEQVAAGRLLPLEEWRRVLEPFEVEELRYYAGSLEAGAVNLDSVVKNLSSEDSWGEDSQAGNRSHILCVLRGQSPDHGQRHSKETDNATAEKATDNATADKAVDNPKGGKATDRQSAPLQSRPFQSLMSFMRVRQEPYPDGISAIVHTRNEARHIAECLASLQMWTDEIIVCDMESSDDTVEIARRFTDQIIAHPRLANFDRARNVSALRARFRWVFYLDADERVPPALGQALRSAVMGRTPPFAGLLPPFRHIFAGQWMQSLYPGYTAPRLFKNGRFLFNARLHAGCEVDGPLACFPADNPELSLLHFSYDSVAHYLEKFNRYTDGEAANMERDGQLFSWQAAIAHWAHDFSSYYDAGQTRRDGVHGLIYAFLGGFYRFTQHAKLYEKHYHNDQRNEQRNGQNNDRHNGQSGFSGFLQPQEMQVPQSVEEVLEYALSVLRASKRQGANAPAESPTAEAEPSPQATSGGSGEGKIQQTQNGLVQQGQGQEGQAQTIRHLPAPAEIRLTSAHPASANLESTHQSAAPHDSIESDVTEIAETVSDTPTPAPTAASTVPSPTVPARLVWSGPLWDPSGYGEESRHFVLACHAAGLPVAAQALPWSFAEVELEEEARQQLQALTHREAMPGFTQVVQTLPPLFARHPEAGFCIGRTMFETDRLPPSWVAACNRRDANRMDALWVPSEWNRATFERAGVAPDKIAVIPGCLDATAYQETPSALWNRLPSVEQTLLEKMGFSPLAVSPQAVSPQAASPRAVSPLTDIRSALSSERPFTFLSVFDWTQHKGWDVLLRAFVEEFRRDTKHDKPNPVRLVLKVWSTMGYRDADLQEQAATFLRQTLGHDLCSDERIVFLHQKLSSAGMRALYAGCDAFVLPSRGEGWGRPYMEAMAWGKPTIGTNWSGNTAFMTQGNSYLVDYRLVPVPEAGYREISTYQGHRWAEPDGGHLRQVLRRVYEEREEAARIGARGRREVLERFNHHAVGRLIAGELQRLIDTEKARRQHQATSPVSTSPVTTHQSAIAVRWEGDFFQWHSLAHVNRALCGALLTKERSAALEESHEPQVECSIELSLVTDEPQGFPLDVDPHWLELAKRTFAPLNTPAQVHIRHAFPPRFQAPPEGHLVLMQPWEYGYLPLQWLEPLQNQVSEVWCYSNYVREVYQQSGIPDAKLHLIPLGVDTQVFNPQAPPYIFTDEPGAARVRDSLALPCPKGIEENGAEENGAGEDGVGEKAPRPFVFLFVGGTIQRKGFDILLGAYLKAFSGMDEVCLVVKDTGTTSVYRGQHSREQILALTGDANHAADESRPPLVYVEPDLSPHQLAGVYTACDCLVMPYRGEGFLLPALESLACGVPVIVPAGGPTDDFVDESVGWRITAAHKPFESPRVGEWDFCGPAWQFEVAVEDLARLMRKVAGQRPEAQRRGERGARRVAAHWTWQQAAQKVRQRLRVLASQPLPSESLVPTQMPTQSPTQSALQTSQATQTKEGKAKFDAAKANQKTKASKTPINQSALNRAALNRGAVNGAKDSQPRPTPTISLCMIVRDEERVLGACLKSIKPYVDEIIVVDTGSTDETVAIAEAEGARVFHFPWCEDFSAARNQSLQHATGDWILWMDADDTIPPQCGARLHDLVGLAEARTTGFLMQVQIPPAPGEVGLTVVDHVKLFRNRLGLRFSGRIHEQILEAIHKLDVPGGGRVERSGLYVVHSGYDYSPEGQQKKRERDLTLLEKELQERPDHPFVLFCIGMTAHHMKEHSKAIESLEKCLQASHPRESIVRKAYAMLAGSYMGQGERGRARSTLEKGLGLYPRDPELLFRAGIIYHAIGELPLAESSYRRLLTERECGHIDSLDVSMTGFKAQHNLALVYLDLGRMAEAEAQFLAALQDNAQFVPSWQGLAELYAGQGRRGDVLQIAAQLEVSEPAVAVHLRSLLRQGPGPSPSARD